MDNNEIQEKLAELTEKIEALSESYKYLESSLEKALKYLTEFAKDLVVTKESLLRHGEFILDDKKTLKSILEWVNNHDGIEVEEVKEDEGESS